MTEEVKTKVSEILSNTANECAMLSLANMNVLIPQENVGELMDTLHLEQIEDEEAVEVLYNQDRKQLLLTIIVAILRSFRLVDITKLEGALRILKMSTMLYIKDNNEYMQTSQDENESPEQQLAAIKGFFDIMRKHKSDE